MATQAERIIARLTWLGLTPEEIAEMLIEFGGAAGSALPVVLSAIRAEQEEAINFAHTVIEHEFAVAQEWEPSAD